MTWIVAAVMATTSRAIPTQITTRTTLVSAVPMASRTTPAAGLMLPQSFSGLNGRLSSSHTAMLRILSRVSTLSRSPAIVATIRRGHSGSTSATATRTSASTGIRTKAPRLNCQERSGATRSNHKSPSASPRMVIRTARRVRGPAPVRYSQITSRPNDSASSSSATATAIIPARRLGTPEAATVSTTPWTAATTLRQNRGGNGAASHGISQPASSSA